MLSRSIANDQFYTPTPFSQPSSRQAAQRLPAAAHPSGRWCKKVRGKIIFFGKIVPDDAGQSAQTALDKWLDEKDDMLAGRISRARRAESGPTLRELVNKFLTAKAALRDAGKLSNHTWQDYHKVSEYLSPRSAKNAC